MRTSLKLLAVSSLLLPGCILVTGDASPGSSHSRSSLEQRVATLEHQLHEMQECCEKSACKCMDEEGEEKDEAEEHAEHAGAH
ncbi:MAG TPA: hypothetical protein VFY71_00815 [Planctomycetota bacterium]|nr:hypothetical protein [Planctomycetota bacterium]